MKKQAWHMLAVERIRVQIIHMLKMPNERMFIREGRMVTIEELIDLLEKSFLAPEAVAEVRTELTALLGVFPPRISGELGLVRKYLRETLRNLK